MFEKWYSEGGFTLKRLRLSTLLLLSSVVMALLATVTVESILRNTVQATRASVKTVPVLVATREVTAGSPLTSTTWRVASVPLGGREPNAFVQSSQVVGKYAAQNLFPGEQLIPQLVSGQVQTLQFADKIPSGDVAMAVLYNPLYDAGGFIQTGDYVSVLGVLTKSYDNNLYESYILANHIYVLSITGQSYSLSGTSGTANATRTVVLAVNPKEANQIAYLETFGQLDLLLEPTHGSPTSLGKQVNNDTVFAGGRP